MALFTEIFTASTLGIGLGLLGMISAFLSNPRNAVGNYTAILSFFTSYSQAYAPFIQTCLAEQEGVSFAVFSQAWAKREENPSRDLSDGKRHTFIAKMYN